MATEAQSENFADELVEAKLLRPLESEVAVESKSSLKKAQKKDQNKAQDAVDAKMAAFMNKKA